MFGSRSDQTPHKSSGSGSTTQLIFGFRLPILSEVEVKRFEPETVAEHLSDLVHLLLWYRGRGEQVPTHLPDILGHLTAQGFLHAQNGLKVPVFLAPKYGSVLNSAFET